MAISTINQAGLNAPLTLTSPVLNSPAFSGTPTGTLVSANMPTGSVLQVVQNTYSTEVAISSTSYVDSGLSLSITPKFATSKILVIASMAGDGYRRSNNVLLTFQNIVRNSTQLTEKKAYFGAAVSADTYTYCVLDTTLTYLDSPATTSATTYKVQGKVDSTTAEGTVRYQTSGGTSVLILMEIAG